ncbi:MAG: orotidine-5'-phosphate decarboxylase [Deltaproteobacteria bacterium]|nr:orotidine-5'-phosphate decarboxylase [Deltaproteobacteria bacterium]
MSPGERIFVALDVPTLAQAEGLVELLTPHVGGFKVGLELLTAAGAPTVIERLRGGGRPIFFDGKFSDIPNTVAGATRAAAQLGVAMLNVHALGGAAMMQAAVTAAAAGARIGGWSPPKVLAVTVLTSLGVEALTQLGLEGLHDPASLEAFIVRLATRAREAGCDGVVASPREIPAIRRACGQDFLIVTPGVRPSWSARGDQHRFTTPRAAIEAGADFLVIGRPVTNPPAEIGDPVAAVRKILEEL